MKRLERVWPDGPSVLLAAGLCAMLGTAAVAAPFVDDFNRSDTTDMGPVWAEQYSDWAVVDGRARSAAGPCCALMTVQGLADPQPAVGVTVDYDGEPRATYVALVLLYLDNEHCLFVKVQDGYDTSPPDGQFDTLWFYMGNNSKQPWIGMTEGGRVWDDLAPYFSRARISAWVVGDEVFVGIDRDFDGQPDDGSLYSRGGIPLADLGQGVGLGGYDTAWADDFVVLPEPATLALVGLGAAALVLKRRRKP